MVGVAAAGGAAGPAEGETAVGATAGWGAGGELAVAPGPAESAAASGAIRAKKTSQSGRER